MLIAKVNEKWFEVGAFYTGEHKHAANENDAVWLYQGHGVMSGLVDVKDIQKFKIRENEEID